MSGHILFGEILRAWSASREVAGRAMGLKYPFIGEDGMKALESSGSYPQQLPDTIIALWVCTLPDATELSREEARAKPWTPAKAFSNPGDAMEAAILWADGKGFASLMSPKFPEATETAANIINEYMAAKFVVEGQPPPEPESGNL